MIRFVRLVVGLSAVFYFSFPTRATIRYEVSLAHPEQHLFHVTMTIPDVHGSVAVQIPAWNALYQVRDFSSHVREVQAFAGEQRVGVAKTDKQTWKITADGAVTVTYTTFWDEPGPFATQLSEEHAFINAAMILFYVPERRNEEVSTIFVDVPAQWQADGPGIQLNAESGRNHSFGGIFTNYDALADAPIEAGRFEKFLIPGLVPQVSVIVHGNEWRKGTLERDLKKICEYELKLMGGAPYNGYTFIYHIGKAANGAGGGMEHANATAIAIPSDEFLDGVSAHEFFHLWNVKRIRPASLEPIDYAKEQYTRALWFAEGVTSTFGSFTLVRSGLWTKQQFYMDLSEQINELETRPANKWQSAEQSSLDAWLEKYGQYSRPDYSVSYYTKGQVLGDLLDILIRDRTDNQKSLDDVMRLMNKNFAKAGETYRDSLDVRLTAEKVVGGSFEDFFERYVGHAEPLPYEKVLGLAGLELRIVEVRRAVLGFSGARVANGGFLVESVEPGSDAERAGLRGGDQIVGWNGGDVPRRLERYMRSAEPGATLRLRVQRNGKDISMELHLGEAQETARLVSEVPNANEKQKRIREGMLRGTTQAVAVH